MVTPGKGVLIKVDGAVPASLDSLRAGIVYWRLRAAVRVPEEQPVGHNRFSIETGGRHAARPLRSEQLTAAHSLFRPARSGRYFGGLWFKVFSERDPC